MTVTVDDKRCIGCGMCAAAVPEVFQVIGRVYSPSMRKGMGRTKIPSSFPSFCVMPLLLSVMMAVFKIKLLFRVLRRIQIFSRGKENRIPGR